MFSSYLIGEAVLIGSFLYSVLFPTPSRETNLCAATALALAVACCLNGLRDLWKEVCSDYERWAASVGIPTASRLESPPSHPEPPAFLVRTSKAVFRGISLILGYVGIIAMLTWAPIRVFPYAHKISTWPGITACIEGIVRAMTSLVALISELLGQSAQFTLGSDNRMLILAQEYLPSTLLKNYEILGSKMALIQKAALSFKEDYRDVIRPIWSEQELQNVWIILWTLCAMAVIVIYRNLIGSASRVHSLSLIIGAYVAGLLNENPVLSELQSVELAFNKGSGASYGSHALASVMRLDTVSYKLSLLETACQCIDKALAFLAISTWIVIALIIMVLPNFTKKKKLVQIAQQQNSAAQRKKLISQGLSVSSQGQQPGKVFMTGQHSGNGSENMRRRNCAS